MKIQIVMSTGHSLSHMLFNNNNKVEGYVKSCADNCFVCRNGLLVSSGEVVSSVTGIKYNVEKNLSFNNGGIYVINAGPFWESWEKTLTHK